MGVNSLYDFYITPIDYDRAAENGVRSALLEVRVRTLGWDKERAIVTPPHKKRSIKDWVEIAERNGICYSTLKYRANRLGWDIERAATQPLQDRQAQARVAYEAHRKYPPELREVARANGITDRTFYRRMKKGWDPKEAATRAPMTPTEIGMLTKEKRERSFQKHARSWNGSYVSR